MDKVTIYSTINTKIRIKKRGFLKRGDYLNLLKMKSVAEAIRYLKGNVYYEKILGEVNPETVSRRDIEDILKRNMIKDIDTLCNYFHNDYKTFIHSLYMKYEIEDLKYLARRIFNGKEYREVEQPLSFLGKYSKIDPAKLWGANTIRDLIYLLKGSEFYEFLIPLIDGRRENLFRLEMALDTGYFNIIQSRRLKIFPRDKKLLKKWEGLVADLYNIQWIYRGKKFYHLLPEELLNYTINFGDKLIYKDKQKMCYARDTEELYRMTLDLPYGFLFKEEEISTDIFMERRINRFLYYRLRDLSRRSPLSIIQTVEYIWLYELEIKDIIAIIESLRYGWSGEEIRKYLVKKI